MKYSFDSTSIDLSPERSGVYALYDGSEIIYYGSSEISIRGRLKRHHDGKEGRCTQSATHFAWEETNSPLWREKQLLTEFEATYHRLPRCNERVV